MIIKDKFNVHIGTQSLNFIILHNGKIKTKYKKEEKKQETQKGLYLY